MNDSVGTYSAFYDEHFGRLVRVLGPIAHDAAEDVAQDAFTELYRNWDEVAEYDVPFAWVRLVGVRAAIRRSRRDVARSRLANDWCRPIWHDPESADVESIVDRLSERQAMAMAMYHIHDRPIAEVADALGCSEAATRVLLHRSRRRVVAQASGVRGRWISERRWTTDQVARHLRSVGATRHVGVILEQHLLGQAGHWVLTLTDDSYMLMRDDGMRLDDGRFEIRGRRLMLLPSPCGGSVLLEAQTDGNRLDAHVAADTTPPTDGVPDHIWMDLFIGSGPFVWAGRNSDT